MSELTIIASQFLTPLFYFIDRRICFPWIMRKLKRHWLFKTTILIWGVLCVICKQPRLPNLSIFSPEYLCKQPDNNSFVRSAEGRKMKVLLPTLKNVCRRISKQVLDVITQKAPESDSRFIAEQTTLDSDWWVNSWWITQFTFNSWGLSRS